MGIAWETERELMIALANDEPKAFESLYLLYGRRLLVFVNSYLQNSSESEEIVQEVFVKIWQKRKDLKFHESLKSYLFTIAFNAIKKNFISRKREVKLKESYLSDYLSGAEESNSQESYSEMVEQIDAIVDSLPNKRKEVFILCKKEGLSVAEVAKYLNISEKTVKNQLTAAYQTIREQVKNSIPLLLALNLFY